MIYHGVQARSDALNIEYSLNFLIFYCKQIINLFIGWIIIYSMFILKLLTVL